MDPRKNYTAYNILHILRIVFTNHKNNLILLVFNILVFSVLTCIVKILVIFRFLIQFSVYSSPGLVFNILI